MDRGTRRRAVAAAALYAALGVGCGGGSKGSGVADADPGPGPGGEPAIASDDDVGSWVDQAALIVVTDHCAGTQSVQMDGPAGRLRLDEDVEIAATPGAATCHTEERFEDEEEGT
jgi:hypothetical protein